MIELRRCATLPHGVVPGERRQGCWVLPRTRMIRHATSSDDTGIENSSTNAAEGQEKIERDSIAIEEQMLNKRRRKKKGAEEKKPYQVVSAARDSVYGDGPQSSIQQFETVFVQVLAFLFFLILGEGIFLGASGFMSQEADQFAQDVVYPLFSPTLGVFLAGSTVYGLWKTKEDDNTTK